MKVILTGATGMVGEGVLLTLLDVADISQVLIVTRREYDGMENDKLRKLVVSDFNKVEDVSEHLVGYDACFYCAGVSSVGMTEADYTHITYATTLHFAEVVLSKNPDMIFCHISGGSTNEHSRLMWARVKGRTERELMEMPFRSVYNFRPGIMKAMDGQIYVNPQNKRYIRVLFPIMNFLMPSVCLTLQEVGMAMLNAAMHGYSKPILEISDIKLLSKC
ncbi:MAG: NAD-dependent epimerase/dehydratase family protein [Ignavibacteria bacterium]|jgi:uncharacterized protein YbjT (DUF2867 family)|nr:NAD-dependent epimerase/dehydratase family protein [Ignavibacteria bacterium]